jgi:hypothetical protein
VLGDLYGLVVLNTVVLSPASFECSELEGWQSRVHFFKNLML